MLIADIALILPLEMNILVARHEALFNVSVILLTVKDEYNSEDG
jgi:hypothetical protein